MRILVLGGTSFLGRHIVDSLLRRNHEVTVFNRGRTNLGLWPEVEELRGDRDGNLNALAGRSWDSVIDTSGYVPRVVRASAELLAGAVPHYIFVSTVSVYADFRGGPDETAPVAELPESDSEDVQKHYGPLKALCERVVEEAFPDGTLIVRPGLIVGPWDPTDRFTYWPVRIARGGDVLAPEPRGLRVQFIDARDLSDWLVRMAEGGSRGVFNTSGPVPRPTISEVLDVCLRVANPTATLRGVAKDFLLSLEVGEWQELPLWVVDPEWAGLMNVEVSRAVDAGLTFRPIDETVRDTLDWVLAYPEWESSRKQGVVLPPAGMDPQREADLVTEWMTATNRPDHR